MYFIDKYIIAEEANYIIGILKIYVYINYSYTQFTKTYTQRRIITFRYDVGTVGMNVAKHILAVFSFKLELF